MPPSVAEKNVNGSLGLTTSAWWSGCRLIAEFGVAPSTVMSVKVTPASVDSTRPRPFDSP